ncbi:chloride channel protein 2-like isoform X1 [Tachysurus ichikawai]
MRALVDLQMAKEADLGSTAFTEGADQSITEAEAVGYQGFDVTKSLLYGHSSVDIEEDPEVKDTMTMREVIIHAISSRGKSNSSLQKVHKIFSIMALDHAYVTSVGRLVGVVSHKELRKAFETSVKVSGAKAQAPMASFRENSDRFRKTATTEGTELHKLLGSQTNLNRIT